MARVGSNLVIGQSGGPTAVINASLVGAAREAMATGEIGGIFGARYGIEGVLNGDLIDLRAQPEDLSETLARTPSAALGSCRYRLRAGDAERALGVLRRYDVRYFLYIGGNDSADTALQLASAAEAASYDLRVLCIPKTIDNDLPDTDHCPGYGSAARFLALATMDSALCTASMPEHYPVKIIEVMGRDAGWLAAATALGKRTEDEPPHLIYFPERPFEEGAFLRDVEAVRARVGYVVAVVAETVRLADGRQLGEHAAQGVDAFGHPLLSGAASYLVGLVRRELGLRARYDKPGDLQRMSSASVSSVDRAEAELVGRAAVREAVRGTTGKMVTLVRRAGGEYGCDTGLTELARVANVHRPMPLEFFAEDGKGVSEAFRAYAGPLIGEPLPRHARLSRIAAPLPS
jgi:6-phosphofructokinase